MHLFGSDISKMRKHLLEQIIQVIGRIAALAADIARARVGIQLDCSNAGAILTTIALFLHQEAKFVQSIQDSTVFFLVIFNRLEEANHRQSTLMFDLFTHIGA